MNSLIVQEKLYDFLLYLYPHLNNFPKHEKLHLRRRIEDGILDMMDSVERSNKSSTKKSHAYEADVLLARLRRLIRLSKDLHFISIHRYTVASGMLSEIGSVLGGWIKWIQSQDDSRRTKNN